LCRSISINLLEKEFLRALICPLSFLNLTYTRLMQIPKKKELKWKSGFMNTFEKNSSLVAIVAPWSVAKAKAKVMMTAITVMLVRMMPLIIFDCTFL